MNIRFSELKQAMMAQMDRNSVVANNLANVNSNGYKRDVVFSELVKGKEIDQSKRLMETDFSQGTLTPTNNPLDLALSGDGFFVIENGDELAYTRDGHFNRGPDGVLRTASGHPVLGETGWIDVGLGNDSLGEVSVSQNGDVFVNGEFIDRLALARFENNEGLQKIGGNLYSASRDAYDLGIEDTTVIQGKIEGSNVTAVTEMVDLIELQRNFETTQKVLRTLDQALSKAGSTIGNYK